MKSKKKKKKIIHVMPLNKTTRPVALGSQTAKVNCQNADICPLASL